MAGPSRNELSLDSRRVNNTNNNCFRPPGNLWSSWLLTQAVCQAVQYPRTCKWIQYLLLILSAQMFVSEARTNIYWCIIGFIREQSMHGHWDFGDGSVSTQQKSTHSYSSPGSYSVTLTGNFGRRMFANNYQYCNCESSSCCQFSFTKRVSKTTPLIFTDSSQ